MKGVRTWIEIDAVSLRRNAEQFLRLLPPETRLMAVVKSNAYGHGLVQAARLLAESRITNQESQKTNRSRDSEFLIRDSRLWFGVDSVTEALRLRREGIRQPILVLGYTLPARLGEAAAHNIALTVSTFGTLKAVSALRARPAVHIKIDTGMHRQGFLPSETFKLLNLLKRSGLRPEAVYTHFAAAKDPADRRYTERQLSVFGLVIADMERAGYGGLLRHAAASGGALLFPESRLDMVRVGMGLYGYWPSAESRQTTVTLRPIMTWKTIISEVKNIPRGALVGYDGTERVKRPTRIAVLPVGYWHGIDRGLSGQGTVLVRGRRARMLGRISMDMTVADVTDIPGVRAGDDAVLIGRQGREAIWADEIGEKIGTTAYEILTRINPLIRRVVT